MSSAAVQQSTSQQYQQTFSAHDRYAGSTSANLASSPPSSRWTSQQGQGNGNGSSTSTPQRAQCPPSANSAAMSTPRGQASPASNTEPMNSSTYQQFFPDSARSGPATVLPIRSSSQQPTTSHSPTAYDGRPYSSGQQQQSTTYPYESDRERASDNERRQRTQAGLQNESASASTSQRSRPAPVQSRSTNAVGQLPLDTSLPRENSAIINHIVVDDPQADIARERARVAEARPNQDGMMPAMVDPSNLPTSEQKPRSRQEHLKQQPNRKEVKFGDYILGQTLGEGEFGKVKMGWKRDSSVQVAIKLIRKESLQSNANRLPKIYREISILRELQHPNIVRLHEFVETERHMGIILEYASGGELFDYILNHRYLKDPAARRLFAQLVSGVGYLHKKGIVHRDLKLENLLLDRNKNIIITDFGFANTFDPNDELSDATEERITDKDFVKSQHLNEQNAEGMRRGDLMQTSCGSPCYAAPELVVSDGLYTGRKVDVWSCGVILYAMLAGYLPFDDDPANPEGDNINLLYKYITSTPLTFPEYVTPHSRDLLRRILVADPRKRADLFEVARHSWLSDYSHVVGFIGSSTKSDRDIAQSAMQQSVEPSLGRSASVREPSSRSPATTTTSGAQRQPLQSRELAADARTSERDAKRRTVQLEYVPPRDATARGESKTTTYAPTALTTSSRTKARTDSQGPVEVAPTGQRDISSSRRDIAASQAMPPPSRPGRDETRAASDSPHQPIVSASRPNTSGTLGSARMPSRGNSYSGLAVPTPSNATAQGQLSQPKASSSYGMPGTSQTGETPSSSRPISEQNLAHYQQEEQPPARAHKRSSTLSSIGDRIMGRSSSRSSRKASQQESRAAASEKKDRKYPPVSMRNTMSNDNHEITPRASRESNRRPSFGFSRKQSDAPSESKRSSRRYSFLPSLSSFTGRKEQYDDGFQTYQQYDRPESKGGALDTPSANPENSSPLYYNEARGGQPHTRNARYDKDLPSRPSGANQYSSPPPMQRKQYRDDGYGGNMLEQTQNAPSEPVERYYTPTNNLDQAQSSSQQYMSGGSGYGQYSLPQSSSNYNTSNHPYNRPAKPSSAAPQHIRPNQRKFDEQYDHGHSGSSSATRRVMDFFRRRGKDRGEE